MPVPAALWAWVRSATAVTRRVHARSQHQWSVEVAGVFPGGVRSANRSARSSSQPRHSRRASTASVAVASGVVTESDEQHHTSTTPPPASPSPVDQFRPRAHRPYRPARNSVTGSSERRRSSRATSALGSKGRDQARRLLCRIIVHLGRMSRRIHICARQGRCPQCTQFTCCPTPPCVAVLAPLRIGWPLHRRETIFGHLGSGLRPLLSRPVRGTRVHPCFSDEQWAVRGGICGPHYGPWQRGLRARAAAGAAWVPRPHGPGQGRLATATR